MRSFRRRTLVQIASALLLFLLTACTAPAVRKENPTPLTFPPPIQQVIFTPEPASIHEVDLGSLLFRKIVRTPGPASLAAAPVGTDKSFPGVEGWVRSWTYTGNDAPGADIVTHPAFYNGAIGVIVGPNTELLTRAPVIQIDGTKKGRRWLTTGGPTLVQTPHIDHSWALRYGGERDGGHRFLIVDYADDKEREIAQDFRISFEDAAKGFSVKGVRVKVLSYGRGRISYSFESS